MAGSTIYFSDRENANKGTHVLFIIVILSLFIKLTCSFFTDENHSWLYTLGKIERIKQGSVLTFNTNSGEVIMDSSIANSNLFLQQHHVFVRYRYIGPECTYAIVNDSFPVLNLDYGITWSFLREEMYTTRKEPH